ncbi:hypothetical protein DVS77_01875 [Mycolicibacterium moriokaense]|nr:hypothetical protein DVS77_01875 [Mycolicibacterium moriokaense]
MVDGVIRLASAAAALSALAVVALPVAAAAPASDDRGYLDSTARCAEPGTAVAFGSTGDSRVAICQTPAGEYQYRGVRISDGAKLIVAAKASPDGAFVADNGGVSYLVTAKALVVSEGNTVVRDEPMVDFHGPAAAAPAPETPTPTTPAKPLPPPLPAEEGHDG